VMSHIGALKAEYSLLLRLMYAQLKNYNNFR
jgi:hypothetical protein